MTADACARNMTKIQTVHSVLDQGTTTPSVRPPESVRFRNWAFPLCASGRHRKDPPTFYSADAARQKEEEKNGVAFGFV